MYVCMYIYVAMMMMIGHALYMYIIAATKEKKSTREHAQTQMYVFKKTTYHTVRFDRNKKKRRKKTGILNDGMVMYVECDDDERSPSFFLSFPLSFLIAFHCSLSLLLSLSMFVR